MNVRNARSADLPAILAIFNEVVATSTADYRDDATTLEERTHWFDSRVQDGFPVMVAETDAGVIGFSSYGAFRGGYSGYIHTVEHSVPCRGRGPRSRCGSRAGRSVVCACARRRQARDDRRRRCRERGLAPFPRPPRIRADRPLT